MKIMVSKYVTNVDIKSKQRPCRTRKSKCQPLPASSAGEAIERMLVERKISTKINYDVLRDLTEGASGQPHSGLSESNSLAVQCQDGQGMMSGGAALVIDRSPSTGGRLPSITTRKRSMSSVTIGLSGVPLSK